MALFAVIASNGRSRARSGDGSGWLQAVGRDCASAMLHADEVDEVVDARPEGDLSDSPLRFGGDSDHRPQYDNVTRHRSHVSR
jgi:hypothetical protein